MATEVGDRGRQSPRGERRPPRKTRTIARSLGLFRGHFLGLFLGLFFELCLTSCQSEVDPAAVSASVVAFGRYEIQAGLPTLAAETTRIECKQGQIFGVDYRIDVTGGEYGTLPIEFRWVHPDLAVPSQRLWGPETPAQRGRPKLAWRESSLSGRALWSLDHVDELVSGRYVFQVRRVGDAKAILSQPFEVFGC